MNFYLSLVNLLFIFESLVEIKIELISPYPRGGMEEVIITRVIPNFPPMLTMYLY